MNFTKKLLAHAVLFSCMLGGASAACAADSADTMPDIAGKKIMVGYWHNWEQGGSWDYEGGYPALMKLAETPKEYNVVVVSFMKVKAGETFPSFTPFYGDDNSFRAEVAKLNAEGRAVLISLGGADAHIEFHKGDEEKLAQEIIRLVETYGFDGLDIDLEQAAITKADNQTVIPAALKMVREHYNQQGKHFIISMAPEFPNLQRSTPNYAPYLERLEGVYDFIAPQLYNQNGAGIGFMDEEGKWVNYTQNDDSKKFEFLYYLSKDLISGKYNTFAVKIPSDKLVLGLPSSHSAAGNGMVKNPQDVYRVFDTLAKENMPLKGLMTWSVNWDEGTNLSHVPFNGQFRKAYTDLIHTDNGIEQPDTDVTTPTVPQQLQAAISVTSVTLSWEAATDDQPGDVSYEIQRNGAVVSKVSGLTFHDAGLQANSNYHYGVRAVDAAGNTSEWNTLDVTTDQLPQHDTQPPSVPAGLVAKSVTATTVTLGWQPATDNVAVDHYVVLRDGIRLSQSITPTYTDKNLTPGLAYGYQVQAVDSSNNNSGSSDMITVTTQEQTSDDNTDLPVWPAGIGSYQSGKTVVIGTDGKQWQCRPFPYGGWCNIKAAVYEPGGSNMATSDSDRAWDQVN